jgi:hypothetical protein
MTKKINVKKRGRINIITPYLISGKHEAFDVKTYDLSVDSIVIVRLSNGYLLVSHGESYDVVMLTENIYEINDYLKETYGIEVVSDE